MILHGNGGHLVDSTLEDLEFILLEGAPAKTIPLDAFETEGGIFLGWSTNAMAVEPDSKYSEGTSVSYDTLDDVEEMNLFACWAMYQFGPNDTQMTFNSDIEQTYTIAQITVDPRARLDNDYSLSNRLLVDFGDE